MRNLALLFVLMLAAPAARAQTVAVDQPVLASVELDSRFAVRVEGPCLVVRDGGSGLFRATVCDWSPITELPGEIGDLQARAFSWNYPHLQDIVFVDLSAEVLDGEMPALTLGTSEGFEFRSRAVHPHDGMGGDAEVIVDYWQRADDEGYLAVMPLDGSRARQHDDGVYAFERESMRWPMAVVRAQTSGELEARMGQALLAYDGAGSREDPQDWWRVPTVCGICQQQQISEVELDLQDRESTLLLRVRTEVEHRDHAGTVPAGMEIDGHTLGPWLSGEQGEEAWFVIPLEEPLADALMVVAVTGDARVRARLTTGEMRDVATVRVQLDPAFEERLYDPESTDEEMEWPNHLSSSLVTSWPNPFRESTTIEITVPGTIGEAFDLEPELLARVRADAAPPFGTAPSVNVKVYNVSGQLVNVLDEGSRNTGRFTVGWNGQDLQGRLVASGTYYVHVEMEEWSVTRRVLLLRN